VVTFGGAYAVLAYMTQSIVEVHGWMTTGQMMDALGLAETTPGPLILVTEFAGFVAGFGAGGWGLALIAAGLTLWVTFVPCFLWIFAFAPYVEWLSGRPRLAAALQGVTAAVVGVIGNLALWFALHVGFATVTVTQTGWLRIPLPAAETLDWRALLIALISGLLLLRLHRPLWQVMALAMALGAVLLRLG
jgi:chromate transporter